MAFTSEHDGQALSLADRPEHTTALEESDGFRALIKIPTEGGEESGNEAVAQLRLVVAERIFQGNGIAEMRDIGSGHKRAGAGLVETHSSQTATEIHGEIVGGIGIRTGGEGALGKRWNFFDSHNAGDFLDEVGLAAEFTAVARNAPAGHLTGGQFFKADTGECGFDFGIREGDAQQVAHTGVTQRNLAAFRAFAGNEQGRFSRATSNLQDQLHRSGGCVGDALGIHTTLEAVAGIAEKAQSTRSAAHTRCLEDGTF